MDISSRVSGVNGVIDAFRALPSATRRKVLIPALRSGAQIIRSQAVDNVKSVVSDEATGLLSRSVVIRNLKPKRRGDIRIAVTIAPKKVDAKGRRVGIYGSVLEYGKEGQTPRPWLRPAASQKAAEAIQQITDYGRQRLEQAVMEARR